jgi:hypothetical protein
VQARPDACFHDLFERLREPVEEARLATELAARDAEPDIIGAEEQLQHAKVGTVEAEVPGGVVGVVGRAGLEPATDGL